MSLCSSRCTEHAYTHTHTHTDTHGPTHTHAKDDHTDRHHLQDVHQSTMIADWHAESREKNRIDDLY